MFKLNYYITTEAHWRRMTHYSIVFWFFGFVEYANNFQLFYFLAMEISLYYG